MSKNHSTASFGLRSSLSLVQSFGNRMLETSLEARVIRQSVLYLFAFIFTAPLWYVLSVLSIHYIFNYTINMIVLVTAPLQGFNNAIIFFRPKVLECFARRKKQKKIDKAQREAEVEARQRPVQYSAPESLSETQSVTDHVFDVVETPREETLITLRARFLQSHFHESSGSEAEETLFEYAVDDTVGSGGIKETVDEEKNVDVDSKNSDDDSVRSEDVIVGAFVLPARRGSALWKAVQNDDKKSPSLHSKAPHRRVSAPIGLFVQDEDGSLSEEEQIRKFSDMINAQSSTTGKPAPSHRRQSAPIQVSKLSAHSIESVEL